MSSDFPVMGWSPQRTMTGHNHNLDWHFMAVQPKAVVMCKGRNILPHPTKPHGTRLKQLNPKFICNYCGGDVCSTMCNSIGRHFWIEGLGTHWWVIYPYEVQKMFWTHFSSCEDPAIRRDDSISITFNRWILTGNTRSKCFRTDVGGLVFRRTDTERNVWWRST